MTARPAFPFQEMLAVGSEFEIIPPTYNVLPPLLNQLVTGQALPSIPEFAYFGFIAVDTFWASRDFVCFRYSKTKKLTIPRSPRSAFVLVDGQP
jgi:hypothetical protein